MVICQATKQERRWYRMRERDYISMALLTGGDQVGRDEELVSMAASRTGSDPLATTGNGLPGGAAGVEVIPRA